MAYQHLIVLWLCVLVAFSVDGQQQLSSVGPDVSDGPCVFPQQLTNNLAAFEVVNPMRKYYIPKGSDAFFRTQYEILHQGTPASSEDQIQVLRPRVQFYTMRAMWNTAQLDVSFEDNPANWYGLRCLPSQPSQGTILGLPLTTMNVIMNMTCTLTSGCKGVVPEVSEEMGELYISMIWTDGDAATIWGCFQGQQNWHIVNTQPQLTAEQWNANVEVLSGLGFNLDHAMDVDYSNTNST